MDKVYIELIQKDSLISQSEISRSKELKYIQLIDSAGMDITTLKIQANILHSDYSSLLYMYEKKQKKIKAHRKIGLAMLAVIVLQILIR